MISGIRSPLLRTLLAVNTVFLAMLLAPTYWPLPSIEIDQGEANVDDLTSLVGEAPLVNMDPAKERPLFHQNRRQAVAIVAKQDIVERQVEEKFNLILMGVVTASDGLPVAYLQNSDTGEAFSVRKSDTVANWTIEGIEADQVTLVSGTKRRALSLNNGG